MSQKAKQRYINPIDNRINLQALKKDATSLPQRHRTWKEFKDSFNSGRHYNCEFMNYKIHIDLDYAFKHFNDNTYSERRDNLNGTLLETLNNPLIVVKEVYEGKNSLVFYKPFINDSEILHLTMHKAVENKETGVYTFKTIFEVTSLHKVHNIINALDLNTIYFKFD